ncbi:unnamed protein product [Brassica rapa subsp. trilocularis]
MEIHSSFPEDAMFCFQVIVICVAACLHRLFRRIKLISSSPFAPTALRRRRRGFVSLLCFSPASSLLPICQQF